jgi:glycosyltransferase involved in cell wall biosynthesis
MPVRLVSPLVAVGPDDVNDHPVVDVVVPVHNEAHVLAERITTLHVALASGFPFSWRITIVDNASTDGTWWAARHLAADLPRVRVLHLDEKGRGRALRAAWSISDADIVAYMDVDLSTGLDALLPLVAPLLTGHSSVAVGSRLASGARVERGVRREVISRCYNRLLHVALGTRVRDAQCGFKALRADAARALLPNIEDEEWFFDTELLVRAERMGLRIVELPVDWVDDPDSRVALASTAVADLKGVRRLVRELGYRARGRRRHPSPALAPAIGPHRSEAA